MGFAIEEIHPQPILSLRTQTRLGDIGDAIGRLFPTLMAVAGDAVTGPIVARYHAWENDAGELELAVHVAPDTPGKGEVAAGELPGGRAAIALHVGPYDGLPQAWSEFRAWMRERGLRGRDAAWEEYVSDCDVTPAAELQTRIVCPLAG